MTWANMYFAATAATWLGLSYLTLKLRFAQTNGTDLLIKVCAILLVNPILAYLWPLLVLIFGVKWLIDQRRGPRERNRRAEERGQAFVVEDHDGWEPVLWKSILPKLRPHEQPIDDAVLQAVAPPSSSARLLLEWERSGVLFITNERVFITFECGLGTDDVEFDYSEIYSWDIDPTGTLSVRLRDGRSSWPMAVPPRRHSTHSLRALERARQLWLADSDSSSKGS